jgi:hypothetical protein
MVELFQALVDRVSNLIGGDAFYGFSLGLVLGLSSARAESGIEQTDVIAGSTFVRLSGE